MGVARMQRSRVSLLAVRDPWLLALLVAGLVLRLVLAALFPGVRFDMSALAETAGAVTSDPLGVYGVNLRPGLAPRWPYPGGYLPVLGVVDAIASATGISFDRLVRLPVIAADLAIAVLVHRGLERSGVRRENCRLAAAVVLFGPAFFLVSAVHGQIDPVAWLFGTAAVVVWMRTATGDEEQRRALIAGLLLGVAVSIKTTPGLLVLALLPTARGPRELVRLALPMAVIPLALTLPWGFDTPAGVKEILDYRGIPGYFGLVAYVSPSTAVYQLSNGPAVGHPFAFDLLDATTPIVVLPLLAVAAILLRLRTPAPLGAVALILTFLAASPSVLSQYFLWLVPFLLLAGHIRAAVVYQLLVTPMLVATYVFGRVPAVGGPPRALDEDLVRYAYVPFCLALTLSFAVAVVLLLRRLAADRAADAPGMSRSLAETWGRRAWKAGDVLPALTIPAWLTPRRAMIAIAAGSILGAIAAGINPGYDSEYHLLWADDLLAGRTPSFASYLAPTQHPLQFIVAIPLVALPIDAEIAFVAMALAAAAAVVWGAGRLAAGLLGLPVGLLAGFFVLVSLDFFNLALRSYVDVFFLALMVWATAIEAERPRSGWTVPVLLLLAGWLRPEAWLIAGLYWLWCFPVLEWTARLRRAFVVAAAPLLWIVLDLLVTGDPTFTFTHTQEGVAEGLRTTPIGDIPRLTYDLLASDIGRPLVFTGAAGFALGLWRRRRPTLLPLAVFLAGIATFAATTASGLDPNGRYVLLPAVMLCAFAAFAILGWAGLEADERVRAPWAVGAAAVSAVMLVVAAGPGVDTVRARKENVAAQDGLHDDLVALLENARVRAAVDRCRTISLPTHVLTADTRWALDLPADRIAIRPKQVSGARVHVWIADAVVAARVDAGQPPAGFDTAGNRQPVGARRLARSGILAAAATGC